MAFAGPVGHPHGTERVRQQPGRSATEPAGHQAGPQVMGPAGRQVGPPVMGPAGHLGARSGPGPAAPARVPAASAAMRLVARRRAQPGNAQAPSDGQGRGRDLAKAGSGDQPPVPEAGPGTETGTGTRLRGVRRANGTPTGPLNARGPTDPGPRGPIRTDPALGGRVRITRRGGVRGFRRPRAAPPRTDPGKTVPGRARRARARRGRAGPASRTRSPLRNSTLWRAPS